jgi:DNA-binding HxlR family transcriptional regulator
MSRGTLHVTGNCLPATELFQLIGDKWTMIVVVSLGEGPMRFSELRRAIPGVSQRMLTLTLRNLERDGFISRKVTPSVPPRVDYELTPLGAEFAQRLLPVGMWAFENRPAVEAARAAFDSQSGDAQSGAARAEPAAISPAASPAGQAAVPAAR